MTQKSPNHSKWPWSGWMILFLAIMCSSCSDKKPAIAERNVLQFSIQITPNSEYSLTLNGRAMRADDFAQDILNFIISVAGTPVEDHKIAYLVDYSWPCGLGLQACRGSNRVLGLRAVESQSLRISLNANVRIEPELAGKIMGVRVAHFNPPDWLASSYKTETSVLLGVLGGERRVTFNFENTYRDCVAGYIMEKPSENETD